MPRAKAEWFTNTKKHLSQMVRSTCTDFDLETGRATRMLVLTADLDGRDISLLLTPQEARAIGIALLQHTNMVEDTNHRHNDGETYRTSAEWAVHRDQVGGTPGAPQVAR